MVRSTYPEPVDAVRCIQIPAKLQGLADRDTPDGIRPTWMRCAKEAKCGRFLPRLRGHKLASRCMQISPIHTYVAIDRPPPECSSLCPSWRAPRVPRAVIERHSGQQNVVAHAPARWAGQPQGSSGCTDVSRGVLCPTVTRWYLSSNPASLVLDPWACHTIAAVGTTDGGSAGDAQAARYSERKCFQGWAFARLHGMGTSRHPCRVRPLEFNGFLRPQHCKVKHR